ncbi:MAG: hypothetical protein ACODAJ_02185 [Planctomycetota bacterium]
MPARLVGAMGWTLGATFVVGCLIALATVPSVPYARWRRLRNALSRSWLVPLGGGMAVAIVVLSVGIFAFGCGLLAWGLRESAEVAKREYGPGMSRSPGYVIMGILLFLVTVFLLAYVAAPMAVGFRPLLRRLAFGAAWRREGVTPFVALLRDRGRRVPVRRAAASTLSLVLERMSPEARAAPCQTLREELGPDPRTAPWAELVTNRLAPPGERGIAAAEQALDSGDPAQAAAAIAALETVIRPEQTAPFWKRNLIDLCRRGGTGNEGTNFIGDDGSLYWLQDDFTAALPRVARDPDRRAALAGRLARAMRAHPKQRYVVSRGLKLLLMLGPQGLAQADTVRALEGNSMLWPGIAARFKRRLEAERDMDKYPVAAAAAEPGSDEALAEFLKTRFAPMVKTALAAVFGILVLNVAWVAAVIDGADRAGLAGLVLLGGLAGFVGMVALFAVYARRRHHGLLQGFRREHDLGDDRFQRIYALAFPNTAAPMLDKLVCATRP